MNTITVFTQMGEFVCAPNQKIAVLTTIDGGYIWKEVQHLQLEDRLIFNNTALPGQITELPESKFKKSEHCRNFNEIKIPKLDTEMAWFFGYFSGNGSCGFYKNKKYRQSQVNVSIPEDALIVIEKVQTCLNRFSVNYRIDKYKNRKAVQIAVSSAELTEWLLNNIKEPHILFDVPEFIRNGIPEIRGAYLAGIFDSDGSVRTRPICIMSCIHKSFLMSVQNLCSSLGFATRLVLDRKAKNNKQNLYRLNLQCNKQLKIAYCYLDPYTVYKKYILSEKLREQYSYSVPYNIGKKYSSRDCSIETIETNYKKLHYTPISIKQIIKNNIPVSTYNIETSSKNEFLCNGLLTCNT